MNHYVLRYGILGGISSIGLGILNWFTIAQAYGPTVSQLVGYLTVVVALLCVPLGIRYFKDKINQGSVSFRKAFGIGAGISLIVALITFFYNLLFFALEGDRFEEWRKQGLSAAELREWQHQMEQLPNFAREPWFQSLLLTVSVFLIGLLMSFISSLVLKSVKSKQ